MFIILQLLGKTKVYQLETKICILRKIFVIHAVGFINILKYSVMNEPGFAYLVGEKNIERFDVQMYYFMVVDEVHSYN